MSVFGTCWAGSWEGEREKFPNASCQELLQNLTPLGTQGPPSRRGHQQTARGRGGEEFWQGPILDRALNQVPAVTEQRHLLGFHFYCSKLPCVAG